MGDEDSGTPAVAPGTTHDEDADPPDTRRCDFCRLPCPEPRVELERDGTTYRFCSRACREAMQSSDRVFTEYHGYQRFDPGVSALSAALPEGLPRSSFVLLSGQAGTRAGAIYAELLWRTLQRGESAVFVSFQEPPAAVVETFLTLDWNVIPYLENDRLHILDAFTYRMENRERMFDRMSEWSSHLQRVAADATTSVRDPSDLGEIENKLDNVLESLDLVDTGIVLFDSLTELGTLVQPVQAYDFVKDVRADICKGRFVPVFAGATYSGETDAFPHDLEYIVDGVVDMELNSSLLDDALVKRVRIRKMDSVPVIPEWTAYEYAPGDGLVPVALDAPASETEESAAASAAEDEVPEDTGNDGHSTGEAATDADPPRESATGDHSGVESADDHTSAE